MSETASRDVTLQLVTQIQKNEKMKDLNDKQAADLIDFGQKLTKQEKTLKKSEDQIRDLKHDLNRAKNDLREEMKDVDYYRDKSRALDFEVKRLKEKNW
jgi:septal ring factor EnvC (AmiA/AmiB activator)